MDVEDEAPIVETVPTKVRVSPEGSVSLKCKIVKGNPLTTQIVWTRNDQRIVPDELTHILVSKGEGWVLQKRYYFS